MVAATVMHGAEMDDKKILVELVNLDSTDETAAKNFVARHGPLKKGEATIYVGEWAQKFRFAWTWRNRTSEKEIETINRYMEDIFKAEEPTLENLYQRPALTADFLAGRWKPQPRNLLDRLALELMSSRKMLHVCEDPECGRYFIKEFSRDKYHHMLCSEKMRAIGQRESAKKNREGTNRRRRKPTKKGRAA
jgi:hypothetical protein